MESNLTKGLLCFQMALLSAITPQLRAVCLHQNNSYSFHLFFYYTGLISDEILDLWNIAATESWACLGPDFNIKESYIRIDEPKELSVSGYYLYLKMGENINAAHIFPVALNELNTTNLRLAIQNAVLGKIPNTVRAIIIAILKEIPTIWVYLDCDEQSPSLDLLKASLAALQYSQSEKVRLQIHYECLPFPAKIQSPTEEVFWSVYLKNEEK